MSSDFEYEHTAMAIAAVSRQLHARGWVPATSGNFSARLRNGDIAITASGQDKSKLSSEGVMRLDGDGSALDDQTPSAETGLHLQLYRRDPDIGAVLHVHSLNAILASRLYPAGVQLEDLELLKVFPDIDSHEAELFVPVFANQQDMPRLAGVIEEFMQGHHQGHAYLLAGHGLYTWADNLERCMLQLEALDLLLEYCLKLKQMENSP